MTCQEDIGLAVVTGTTDRERLISIVLIITQRSAGPLFAMTAKCV